MRDCKNCKHLIMYDYKNKSYSCEKWECKFEPKEQEPFMPMVEIDLDYVIKQKYIEREVLDKIRAEIEQLSTTICTETRRIYIDADDFKENVLAIFDKYKVESEEE